MNPDDHPPDVSADFPPFAIPAEAQAAFPPPTAPSTASRHSRKRRADTDAASSTSSPTKRSRTSQGSDFSERRRNHVKELYRDCCWACELDVQVQVAHVFAKADEQFTACRDAGLTALQSKHQEENALPLCIACHDAYDAISPLLVIVPTHLDFFFEAEHAWQRSLNTPGTTPRLRPPVSEGSYAAYCKECHISSGTTTCPPTGALYTAFMVKNYKLANMQPMTFDARTWHGDPGAILWHARKIHHIAVLPPSLQPIKQQLAALEALYDHGNLLQQNVAPLATASPAQLDGPDASALRSQSHQTPAQGDAGPCDNHQDPAQNSYISPTYTYNTFATSPEPERKLEPKRKRYGPRDEVPHNVQVGVEANQARKRRKLSGEARFEKAREEEEEMAQDKEDVVEAQQMETASKHVTRWGGRLSSTEDNVRYWRMVSRPWLTSGEVR